MNNEPVAWMEIEEGGITEYKVWREPVSSKSIPLYTHPVKEQGNPVAWRSQDPDGYWSVYQSPVEGAEPLYTGFKELTDEEIIACIDEIEPDTADMIRFARAILRKASEK